MSTVRLEGLVINIQAVVIEGVEDPTSMVTAVERVSVATQVAEDPNPPASETKTIKEVAVPAEAAPPIMAETVEEEDLAAPKRISRKSKRGSPEPSKEAAPEESRGTPSVISVDDFKDACRLRDIIQVFMDAGVTEKDAIVENCLKLKEDVALLRRVADIKGRIPLAVDMWAEKNKVS
jgi:hypothetical protein